MVKCPRCGGTWLGYGYGFSGGGGVGPWTVCFDCDRIISKSVDEPGQCLHEVDLLEIERLEFIRTLSRRAVKLQMWAMLCDAHKSPWLLPEQWEQMLATYRECFPGSSGPELG